jgi:predicted ribosome-associated RNA-binding protein Tma20
MDISSEMNERVRFKNLAVEALVKEYRSMKMNWIVETDLRKIFNYLERYCEIINGGKVPIRIYKSSDKCSVFWMKGKILMFFFKLWKSVQRHDSSSNYRKNIRKRRI